jgi:ATP-dependent helicase/nuclease subunit B
MTAIVPTEDDVLTPQSWPWAPGRAARECWDQWACTVSGWCADNGLSPKDVVVLLPVGALLPVARQAWARAVGGWLPQIETVPTLAEALAWSRQAREPAPVDPAVGPPPTLDVVLDRLLVTQALTAQTWGQQWARRDRRAFDHAVAQVVDGGHLWVRVAQACPPEQRSAYWETCREALGGAAAAANAGPGARERLLLAWALEWAASSDDGRWATDVLFSHQAHAWVGVTAGATVVPGSESSLMLAVLRQAAQSKVPTLWMNAEAVTAPVEGAATPALALCMDFEDEAQRATAQVLTAVNTARALNGDPVALVALDRSLVRRVRALLEGAGATVSDETGWKLSTTRAGAAVTRLLVASRPNASTDDLLDWLKSGWVQWPQPLPAGDFDAAVAALETWCRRHGLLAAWGLGLDKSASADLLPDGRQAMPESARQLWLRARQTVALLAPLWASKRAPLSAMLSGVSQALQDCGAWQALLHDLAGAAVLEALRLKSSEQSEALAWPAVASGLLMDGQGVSRWVDQVLEESSFRLASAAVGDAQVDVVVTPLTRAVLRPFSAIVMPGADERQLGAMDGVPGWVHGLLCEQMGLPTKTTMRDAQWASFGLLMAQPEVACLCREANGREPLEPSPWFERWAMHTGLAMPALPDARLTQVLAAIPVRPPLPSLRQVSGSGLARGPLTLPLPSHISATSYESLRQCPYRFFAQHVLGLRALDELEEGVDRSDFGVWLHAVLQCFHARRDAPQLPLLDDEALWVEAAHEVTRLQGLDRDSRRPYFLPFAATLERMAHHYVTWLHGHEGDGWRFARAEEVVQWPMALSNDLGDDITVTLHGQLDRLDRRGQGEDTAWCVIDYKTGSQDGLKQKVKQPLEDTQLAFYAALAQHAPATAAPNDPQRVTSALEAMYLHLDEKGVTPVKHPHVIESAQAVVEGVRMDLTRLLAGAAMPALGEGVACEYCDVRGLCRRDHWTLQEAAS